MQVTAHHTIRKLYVSTWLPSHESFRQLQSDTSLMHHLQSISLETQCVMEHGDLQEESRRKREIAAPSGVPANAQKCGPCSNYYHCAQFLVWGREVRQRREMRLVKRMSEEKEMRQRETQLVKSTSQERHARLVKSIS